MKKLMMTLVATACAAVALAQESAAPAETAPARPAMPPRFERMSMGGAMGNDPILRAVMNPKVAEAIGLSDEQKAKIKELRNNRASREFQDKFRKGMELQSRLLAAETIDEAAVMAAIDEAYEARKNLAKEQTRRVIAVRSILTPEQVKKALTAMRDLRGSRVPRGRGKAPGKGPADPVPPPPPADAPAPAAK